MTKPFLIPKPQCLTGWVGGGTRAINSQPPGRQAGCAPASCRGTWLPQSVVTACAGSLTGRAWVSREMVKLWLRSWVFDLTSDLSALFLGAGVPCGALRDGPQPGGDVEGGATPEHPTATAVASLAPGSGSQPGPWTPFCRAKAVDSHPADMGLDAGWGPDGEAEPRAGHELWSLCYGRRPRPLRGACTVRAQGGGRLGAPVGSSSSTQACSSHATWEPDPL